MNIRDRLLKILTHDVRMISSVQICQLSPEALDHRGAGRLVAQMASSGFITRRVAMVHPPLHLAGPAYEYISGNWLPDFDKLAYLVQERWRAWSQKTYIVSATPKAAALTGGPLPARRFARDADLAHDLTCTQIFLDHYESRSDCEWVPEDALPVEEWPRTDAVVPDALVRSAQGEVVLELAGRSYSAKRLRAIHDAFERGHYQLW